MKTEIKKIVTHPGVFHADEALGTAYVWDATGRRLPVVRERVREEDLIDPFTLVLDEGGQNAPSKGNIDHHQDGDLPATNVLVVDHFAPNQTQRDILFSSLFERVSNIDRGIEKVGESIFSPNLTSIIRNLNNLPGSPDENFQEAVKVAGIFLRAAKFSHGSSVWELHRCLWVLYANGFDEEARTLLGLAHQAAYFTTKKAAKGEILWASLEKDGPIAIQEIGDFIPGWKELAAKDGIEMLLCENLREPGKWQITVRDSDVLKIPTNEGQTFLHASGFFAVYENRESCEAHAREIAEGIIQ